MINAKAQKHNGLDNQQPSSHTSGEGSTTIAQASSGQETAKCPESVKTCCRCGEVKPLSGFYKRTSGKLFGHCKACNYKVQREYARKNPQILKACNKKAHANQYAKKKETILAYAKEWRDKNPEYASVKSAEWRKGNPGLVNFYKATDRAYRRDAVPAWADKQQIVAIYDEAKEKGLVVDHKVPLRGKTVCGLHIEYNLQLLTRSENARKYNKFEQIKI